MSNYYKKRFEIVFLCLHPRGPKMSKEAAAKYLKVSKGEVYLWCKRYQETGVVDDVQKTGRNKVLLKNKIQ